MNDNSEQHKYSIKPGEAALILKVNDQGNIEGMILESQIIENPEKSLFVVDTIRTLLYILMMKPDLMVDAYSEMDNSDFIEENETVEPFAKDQEEDSDQPEWARNTKGNA